MENKKNISSSIRNFCIASFLIIVAAISFYFCYWTQRPMYAIQNIVIATQTGDTELFKKHIDLPSVYGDAYDVYTDFLTRKNDLNIKQPKWLPKKFTGNMAFSILKTFKSDFVQGATNMTLKSIEKRKAGVTNATTEQPKQEKPFTKIFLKLIEQIAEENNLSGLKAENVFVTQTDDTTAEGIVTFKNKSNQEPLQVKFIMKKYDKIWQITKIENVLEIIGRVKINPVNIEDIF